jgi:hypothetical protein
MFHLVRSAFSAAWLVGLCLLTVLRENATGWLSMAVGLLVVVMGAAEPAIV